MLATYAFFQGLHCPAAAEVRRFDQQQPRGGIPVGNFGLCAEITQTASGGASFRLGYNPPIYGQWLIALGTLRCEYVDGGRLIPEDGQELREFPLWSVSKGDELLLGALCPLAKEQTLWNALPVLCVEGDVEGEVLLRFDAADLPGGTTVALATADAVAVCGAEGSMELRAGPGPVRIVLAVDHAHNAARHYYEPEMGEWPAAALAGWTLRNGRDLRAATESWCLELPKAADAKLNSYARWYSSAAVCLTRVTRRGAWPEVERGPDYPALDDLDRIPVRYPVITLGYTEHNPRDGYWTSFPHLLLWPELERDMIAMYFAAQGKDGSFQCCFPLIWRDKCIDWTGYVLHRIYRYVKAHGDWTFARKCFESGGVEDALDFLLERSKSNGMAEQLTFWGGDWKDVPAMEGRLHAPHFVFLTLAAFRATARMAEELDYPEIAAKAEQAYQRGYARVHLPVDEGGLWNGRYYVTRWKDGSVDDIVQQDQVAGILFGVVPEDRWQSVLDAVREINHGPHGPRETYPYRAGPGEDTPENERWLSEPGEYHNGGVWPLMVGVEALTRVLRVGTEAERKIAEEMLLLVGYEDLERFGDYGPHEYLNGETGENKNFWLQGWSSMMAAAVWALAEPDLPIWEGLQVGP